MNRYIGYLVLVSIILVVIAIPVSFLICSIMLSNVSSLLSIILVIIWAIFFLSFLAYSINESPVPPERFLSDSWCENLINNVEEWLNKRRNK